MENEIGTVRRESHEDGFSLWLLMQKWDESTPVWRCVYSTAQGNVGHSWTIHDGPTESNTSVVGSLPGTVTNPPGRITCPLCGRSGRSLTKQGKIRHHDLPATYTGERTSRFCAAGGLTMDEAQRHRELPREPWANANQT